MISVHFTFVLYQNLHVFKFVRNFFKKNKRLKYYSCYFSYTFQAFSTFIALIIAEVKEYLNFLIPIICMCSNSSRPSALSAL